MRLKQNGSNVIITGLCEEEVEVDFDSALKLLTDLGKLIKPMGKIKLAQLDQQKAQTEARLHSALNKIAA